MTSPLAKAVPGDIDFLIVRENTEGEYSDQGMVIAPDSDEETVIQHAIFSRKGVDRILRYGFDTAMKREKNLHGRLNLIVFLLVCPSRMNVQKRCL